MRLPILYCVSTVPKAKENRRRTFLLCQLLEFEQRAVGFIEVAEISRTLIRELLIVRLCLILFILFLLLAHEELFDTRKLFRTAKVSKQVVRINCLYTRHSQVTHL